MKTIIIVGANACGGSAASRLRRLNENLKIILLEKGSFMSFANCGLPYYVGGAVKYLDDIDGQSAEIFAEQNDIDVRLNHEVIAINIVDKRLSIYDHKMDRSYEENYDELVLATGAELNSPKDLDLSNENIFPVLTVNDAEDIDEYISRNPVKTAIVMGGGYIGMEMVEQLAKRELDVTLITSGTQVLNLLDREMANIVHKKLFDKGVQLFFESSELTTSADIVIVATGVKPNILLAEMAGLDLGEYSGVIVDDYLRTSNEHIWAGGDLVEVKNFITNQNQYIPLAGPANRHGHIIAGNILGKKIKYRPSLGTSLLKIFELTVGMTGINESMAEEMAIEYESVYIHAKSHASYYPGAKPLTIKLIFAKEDYRILGAQIVGEDGVDKRIDVISTAIQSGVKAYELDDIELAYAPPYGTAKDPVNVVGMLVSNIKDSLVKQIQWQELDELEPSEVLLIDVRPSHIDKALTMKGAVQIPYDKLRETMPSSVKHKEIILFCGDGALAYDAYRMLELHGFNKMKILAGGLKTYADAHYLQTAAGAKNLLGTFLNTVLV
jgi:NADPH-dependent 2,4-dienoyl-CoA reductase/sulfur reductase-like enzyme/rhodanese-related sulfurtransferase